MTEPSVPPSSAGGRPPPNRIRDLEIITGGALLAVGALSLLFVFAGQYGLPLLASAVAFGAFFVGLQIRRRG